MKVSFLSLKFSNMLTFPFPGDSFALGVRGLGGEAGKRTKRKLTVLSPFQVLFH